MHKRFENQKLKTTEYYEVKIILLIVKICFILNCLIVNVNGSELIDAKHYGGFRVQILDDRLEGMTTTDQPLYYSISATNGPISIWIPKQPEYAYQVELLDESGKKVQKTELGQKVGSKFLDLNPLLTDAGIKLRRSVADKPSEGLEPIFLFKTSDFFEIKKAGTYTLQFNFHFYIHVKEGTNDFFKIVGPPSSTYLVNKFISSKKNSKAE